MRTSWRRTQQNNAQISTNQGKPYTQQQETEKRSQTEFEIWEQHVQQEARQEASKKGGSLELGDIETQLKRVSERVTREAQEKRTYEPKLHI